MTSQESILMETEEVRVQAQHDDEIVRQRVVHQIDEVLILLVLILEVEQLLSSKLKITTIPKVLEIKNGKENHRMEKQVCNSSLILVSLTVTHLYQG